MRKRLLCAICVLFLLIQTIRVLFSGAGDSEISELEKAASGEASVILTGLNLFTRIAKWGGAGALVPITGFANSVAAPAIEYQKEGQVFGIGCKIFTIAGPVLLYGTVASWLLGLIYWLLKAVGVL